MFIHVGRERGYAFTVKKRSVIAQNIPHVGMDGSPYNLTGYFSELRQHGACKKANGQQLLHPDLTMIMIVITHCNNSKLSGWS